MDGENLQIDANYGVRLGQKGFINFTGSALTRRPTSRADFATGSIFNAYNAIEQRTNIGKVVISINDEFKTKHFSGNYNR